MRIPKSFSLLPPLFPLIPSILPNPIKKRTSLLDLRISIGEIPSHDLRVLAAADDPPGVELEFEDAVERLGEAGWDWERMWAMAGGMAGAVVVGVRYETSSNLVCCSQ